MAIARFYSFMFLFSITISLSLGAEEIPVIQIPAEPHTLDPALVEDVLGFSITSNMNEGLVRLDNKGQIQNGLAESYEISKDLKRYFFRLKKSARWSDGKPVTIEEVIAGLRRTLDPKTAARDSVYLSSIEGAKEFRAGKSQKLGITQKGTKLEIRLAQPDSAFLSALTMPMAAPIRIDLLNTEKWKESFPTTGPYFLSSHKLDKEILLHPNPYYQPAAKSALKFLIIPEETTALNLFETGKVQVLSSISPTEITRLSANNLLQSFPSAATYFLLFNVEKSPFNKIQFREAVLKSIDNNRLAMLLPLLFSPAKNFIPSTLEGGKYVPKVSLNSSTTISEPSDPVTISYASSATANMLMERAQFDWQQKLGWKIKLEPLEWKSYIARLQTHDAALFYFGYSAPFNSPLSHLRLFLSTDPNNRSRLNSKKYDSLMEKITLMPSGKNREKLIEKALAIVLEKEVAVVPLLERKQLFGVNKNLKGFFVNPFGVMDLKSITP